MKEFNSDLAKKTDENQDKIDRFRKLIEPLELIELEPLNFIEITAEEIKGLQVVVTGKLLSLANCFR